jgi:transcriptional regulator with XRE-family HTH domain
MSADASRALHALGSAIRQRRKALGISAQTTAEAAGMSRVTLHRIESGEPSVTMGAYANALAALGMDIEVKDTVIAPKATMSVARGNPPGLPDTLRIGDYPHLKELAWQLPGTAMVSPQEALQIYERNWRHLGRVDRSQWEPHEQALLSELIRVHGKGHLLV